MEKGGLPMNSDRVAIKIMILCFIIAILLIAMGLIYPVRADLGQSVFDGEWTIIFTDCAGKVRTYFDCKISELTDSWITFTQSGRSQEIMLPLQSVCATIVMERER